MAASSAGQNRTPGPTYLMAVGVIYLPIFLEVFQSHPPLSHPAPLKMAWAIEEYKAILIKAYARWYRAKGGERRKEVERQVVNDLEKVNKDREAANAPILCGPKQGFTKVHTM
jgi:hypothetical protein